MYKHDEQTATRLLRRRWLGQRHFLAAATLLVMLVMVATPALAAAGAGEKVKLEGTVYMVWGDPPLDSGLGPQTRYFLEETGGDRWELSVDEDVLHAAGGIDSVHQAYAEIDGWVDSDRKSRLVVDSIRPITSLTREDYRVSGSQPYVWILLRFADNPSTPEPASWFEDQAGTGTNTIDDYYRANSFHHIDIVGSDVVGWYDLPNDRSYYVYDWDNDGDDNLDFARARDDAIALADGDVYFPDYVGINLIFNEVLDCCAWGGSANITVDGTTKVYGVTYMPPVGWRSHGIMSHEMGHSFSLPHSSGPYGATYDSQWDVMSACNGTCAYSDPVWGCLSVHTIAYHKDKLDWIASGNRYVLPGSPVVRSLTMHDLSVSPPGNTYQYVEMPLQYTAPSTFYTIERRRQIGYDLNLPGEGILMHTVDPSRGSHALVVDADGDGDCNDDGATWEPGEYFVDYSNGIVMMVESANASQSVITITNAARSSSYVDWSNNGYESGTSSYPWNTVWEGFGSLYPDSTVYIAPGSYDEQVEFRKPATLQRHGASGTVIIGE